MEKITPGKVVSLIYELYAIDEDGKQKLMHEVDPKDPETLIFGVTPGVIVPLERALEGQEVGYKFNVVANPNEAFGEYSQDNVLTLAREFFEVDGKFDDKRVKVGHDVPILLANGSVVNGKVLDITPESVVIDFNHPLAGKIVRLKGSVIDIREATPEEIHIAQGGGCGGCGGGCGSCGDGQDGGCGCQSSGEGCGCSGC